MCMPETNDHATAGDIQAGTEPEAAGRPDGRLPCPVLASLKSGLPVLCRARGLTTV